MLVLVYYTWWHAVPVKTSKQERERLAPLGHFDISTSSFPFLMPLLLTLPHHTHTTFQHTNTGNTSPRRWTRARTSASGSHGPFQARYSVARHHEVELIFMTSSPLPPPLLPPSLPCSRLYIYTKRRLYILQSTKGIQELAGRMQTLTKVLDALKST